MEPSKADPKADHAFFDPACPPSLLDCSPCISSHQLNKLTTMTTEQAQKLIEFMGAIASLIKEVKEIPSGHLYAQLMGKMTLDQYQNMIATLQKAGLVSLKNDLLTYTGE
jgi:hypothetical protein